MDVKKLKGSLTVTTIGGQTNVGIEGKPTDVMFNLAILTEKVCKALDITVDEWAMALPVVVRKCHGHIYESISIDATRIKGGHHGNSPSGKHPDC